MKSIDEKIADSEAEWHRYRYDYIGVRESGKAFCAALKRSAGKNLRRIFCTAYAGAVKKTFRTSYDKNRINIVVSLTSTGSRISNIMPALNSLISQSRKPDLIILWLGKDESYPAQMIKKIRKKGITIRFREDLGPHTKYYHAFREYKNDLIITVDDDIIYHKKMVEELYSTYLRHKGCVIARRVNRMRFDHSRKLLRYTDWIWEYRDAKAPAYDLLATGVGGILYPPKILKLKCWENKDFLNVCPWADDIWLKFCELSADIKIKAVHNSRYALDVINKACQKSSLSAENVDKGKNDEQIDSCIGYFDMGTDLCERVLS